MRLIFKGKILKDEMTLDDYKITDGLTVHVVKGKSAGAPATTVPVAAPTSSLAGAADANAGAGAAQPNPMAAMGGMGGMGGFPGFGGQSSGGRKKKSQQGGGNQHFSFKFG